MITTIIAIYFAINIFFAGYFLREEYKFQYTKTGQFLMVLTDVFTFSLQFVVYLLWYSVLLPLEIKFWFLFLFTKKFTNLDEDTLERINSWELPRGRVHRAVTKFAIQMINRRNGN